MINKFYKSICTVALVSTMLCGGNATAQDAAAPAPATPAVAAAPSAGGDVAAGTILFKNNCQTCHNPSDEKLTGPGLKDIEKRREYPWIKSWINNPAAVIASGDKYAVDLYNQYNKTSMTAFPAFGDAEVKNILAYISDYNTPKVAAAGTVPAGGGTSNVETGGGKFFNILLVSLLAIMALVLVALFSILKLLSKLTGSQEGAATHSVSFVENLTSNFKNITSNATIRKAVIWLFILLGTKATFDGLYGIGIHQGYAPKQPIPFSHKLHAGEYKINCAYCHTGVYKGKQAGIPSANICMNCHNAIKRESPYIQQIYTALEKDQPIEWVRVHNLPDLAYFNHAQHTNVGGLECSKCHGEINKMEVVQQKSSLTMGWCIDCHRKTEVNSKGNAYYDKLLEAHNKATGGHTPMNVKDIGGLECSKCHY
jgi:mono/diheme cytochrome c family protein